MNLNLFLIDFLWYNSIRELIFESDSHLNLFDRVSDQISVTHLRMFDHISNQNFFLQSYIYFE